jgi:hypothetical protein
MLRRTAHANPSCFFLFLDRSNINYPYRHGIESIVLPTGLLNKHEAFLFCPVRAERPAFLIHFNLIMHIVIGDDNKSSNFLQSVRNFAKEHNFHMVLRKMIELCYNFSLKLSCLLNQFGHEGSD